MLEQHVQFLGILKRVYSGINTWVAYRKISHLKGRATGLLEQIRVLPRLQPA